MTQLRVLTVCTANVCRSPVAERLLARHLAAAGWGDDAVVRSAGTHGGSLGVHSDTLEAALAAGADLTGHESRLVTRAVLEDDGADLVVTMAREHTRYVAAIDPTAWPRTFTLKELVRRGGDTGVMGAADMQAWLAVVGEGRRAADLMRPDLADDIADPYGGPSRAHAAMVAEIDELASRLARLLRRS